ncbi:MAG TPA: hypothetical protein VFS00_18895 [Polyangiaceae bacterium]|nr:hypothetical protein [Polyangiaceae bacterium]
MRVFREGVRRLAPLALVAATHASAAPARAQSSGDKAVAVELFKRGRQLMEEKRYGEACPLFAESQRLDPSGGTLLNLAYCHEQDGHTATAWAYYQDLLGRARHEGRADRVRFAQARLTTLEPQVPHWTVVLGPNEKLAGVEVFRDGQTVPRPLWGIPVPVDPGPHQLEVRATDHKRWSSLFKASAGKLTKIEVPPLEAQGSASAPPDERPPPPAIIIETDNEPLPPADRTGPRPAPRVDSGRTVAGAVLGGVGLLGLGVGTYFGLTAFALREDVRRACDDGCEGQTRVDAADDNREGRTFAHVSTASFGVGLIGIGLGAYFLLTAPSATAARASRPFAIEPRVGAGGGGLSLTRVW